MKDLGKMLLITALVILAFTPMFRMVHAKATALDTCMKKYNPTPETRSQVVDYCMEATHGKVR